LNRLRTRAVATASLVTAVFTLPACTSTPASLTSLKSSTAPVNATELDRRAAYCAKVVDINLRTVKTAAADSSVSPTARASFARQIRPLQQDAERLEAYLAQPRLLGRDPNFLQTASERAQKDFDLYVRAGQACGAQCPQADLRLLGVANQADIAKLREGMARWAACQRSCEAADAPSARIASCKTLEWLSAHAAREIPRRD